MKTLKIILVVLFILLITFFVAAPAYIDKTFNKIKPVDINISDSVRAFHSDLFVADLHNDILLWDRDMLTKNDYGHSDLPRMQEGNMGLQVFSVVTKTPWGINYENNPADSDQIFALMSAQLAPPTAWFSLTERALLQADRLKSAIENAPDDLQLITKKADLINLRKKRENDNKSIGALLAIEGMHALDAKKENLDILYKAGYRMMGPTHFFDNAISGSAHGITKNGLTPLGKELIKNMEELGITIDIAHASPKAINDILDMATKPVVVSHTGVKATCPGKRNLSDGQIKLIAANGGLIGIGFWPGAVCGLEPESIVNAIKHVVKIAGIKHVALGSDYDGATSCGFDISNINVITQELTNAGFSKQEIILIMGENMYNFLLENLPSD